MTDKLKAIQEGIWIFLYKFDSQRIAKENKIEIIKGTIRDCQI